ncbi:MAG: tyrosine--tRNA ligase [Candidatus ainarchaeum sp.]|nr:tyrosine--tRNA ligase [Candidatus ainarchaeum sp.]MDD3975552.1 tyrosine--tRNA ligase [Candidatus ainarchaeum sp.]
MNIDEKINLIKRNTQEIISEEELRKLLEEKKQPVVYLGTSVTGRPHIGYFTWAQKLNDFLNAGFKVKVLLADLHGALDNTPWDLLEKRYKYYSIVITGMIEALGGNLDNFEIVKGSDFQLSKEYVLDLYKLSSEVTIRNAEKASSDVVKQKDSPKLSGILYPLLQALDEVYLDADVQLGAIDQRKIFVLAREFLPKLGYKPRVEVMIPFIRGLTPDGKMSSSNKASKIDLIDNLDTIKQKMKKAYCEEGNPENGVLDFAKLLIMTQKQDKNEEFVIDRPEKWGGSLRFKTQEDLEKAFISKDLHPMDLKQGVSVEVDKLLEPIRQKFVGKEEIIKEAYPEE